MNRYGYLLAPLAIGSLFASCSVYDEGLLTTSNASNQGGGGSAAAGAGGFAGGGAGGGTAGQGGSTTTGGGGGSLGGTGGSAAAGGDGGSGGTNECGGSEQFPRRPTASEVVTPGGSIEFVAVMYELDLGDRQKMGATDPKAYLNIGLDIDGRCGVSTPPETDCNLPAWAFGIEDGPRGIDNAMGAIIQNTRNLVTNFTSTNYTAQIQAGGTSVIYNVKGYNGEPNDDEVTVATFVAAPYATFTQGDASADVPNWDGTDHCWPLASDSVLDVNAPLDSPAFVDTRAYVRDNRLYLSQTQVTLRLDVALSSLGNVKLDLQLNNAKQRCDLVQTDAGAWYMENCTLAGRWVTNDLIHSLSQFPDPSSTDPQNPDKPLDPLCTDSALYCSFREAICNLTDIASIPPADPTRPEGDCDALSFGILLSTRPGCVGDVWQVDPVNDRCPTGTQPSADDCRLASPPGNSTCVRTGN